MHALDLNNVQIKLLPPATYFSKVDGRSYIVDQHHMENGVVVQIGYFEHFLNHNEQLTAMWEYQQGAYVLIVNLAIDGNDSSHQLYNMLKSKIDIAIKAIAKAEAPFLHYYSWLMDSPIYVKITSKVKSSDKPLLIGKLRHFLVNSPQETLV